MPGPVTDARAYALREQYHRLFAGEELPVPVESIAEDLLGLLVEEIEIDYSGLLLPSERRLIVNASEPDQRRRFTLAHEVGHWVCQVAEGHAAPVFCRTADLGPDPDRSLEREANVFAAELLMPEPLVRAEWKRAPSCTELASTFGVSDEAMHWRLFNFDLVAEPPA